MHEFGMYFRFVIPALVPVARDLFCHRGSGSHHQKSSEADLEAQREVMLSMLMKTLHFPQIVETVVKILQHYKGDGSVTTER